MKTRTITTKHRTPLVSVVMPVHNAGLYLREAIDSILHQTYTRFELIVVDDASTDKSWKIIQSYKKRFPYKIRAFRLKHALGQSGDPATNIAISKARGSFIAKMDADDIAHPTRLAKQVHFLKTHEEIFMVGSHAYIINRDGDRLGIKATPTKHDRIYNSFFLYNSMIHPTIMFRNLAQDGEHNRAFYSLNFPFFNEYYTFFKFMHDGKLFANIGEPLLYYRVHGTNDTFSHTKKKFRSTLSIRKAFVKEFGYMPSLRQLFTTFVQACAVFILPERALVNLYLVSKKVISPQSLIPSPLLSFKRFAYSIYKV